MKAARILDMETAHGKGTWKLHILSISFIHYYVYYYIITVINDGIAIIVA